MVGRFILMCCIVAISSMLCSCGGRSEPSASELKLCASVGLDAATCSIIKGETDADLVALPKTDAEGNEGKTVGVQFSVPSDKTDEVRERLSIKLKPQGCLAFVTERHYNIDKMPDKVGVMKTNDQYDILKVRQSSGPNYDIDNAAVIAKLKQWEKAYPFDITGAADDSVELELKAVPSDVTSFAKDVYEFCPDIVDQGVGTVAALADEIKKTRALMLWWD